MTPPLTDAELLAYIERTEELAALFPNAPRWLKLHDAERIKNFARAFHAHEQRVRGEMQAKIDALMLEYCPDEMTPEQVAEWGRHQKRVPEPTAPQLSTADVSTAPSPEGAGQGEAAEAVGLLREVFGAYVLGVGFMLADRAALLRRVSDFLAKQGGK